jgi:hypothetical protein
MHGDARMPPDQLALEVLEQATDTHERLYELACEIRDALSPAAMRTVRLTAGVPIEREIGDGKSLSVLNPTGITIYVGVGGSAAKPASGAVPVPPGSLLTLPVSVNAVEIGAAAADLAAGDAVLFAFVYPAVQAAHLGVL